MNSQNCRQRAAGGGGPYRSFAGSGPLAGPFFGNFDICYRIIICPPRARFIYIFYIFFSPRDILSPKEWLRWLI